VLGRERDVVLQGDESVAEQCNLVNGGDPGGAISGAAVDGFDDERLVQREPHAESANDEGEARVVCVAGDGVRREPEAASLRNRCSPLVVSVRLQPGSGNVARR